MNAHEVVPHVEQGDGMDVILNPLTKGIRKSGEPPHLHPHGKVLSLDTACGAWGCQERGISN